jgi:hypothetical protein
VFVCADRLLAHDDPACIGTIARTRQRAGHANPRRRDTAMSIFKRPVAPVRFPRLDAPKGWAECPAGVAAPEIAFPSRQCNKTGHNQQ